ncbi:MAG: hypothetical protein JRD89_20475 [Deltaproteobacteria bacterium]|nr:hypothetical protein [Deltaproteobacteria bacterium]
MTPAKKIAAAQAMIKAIIDDDGKAEINGRTYQFVKMTHKKRRRVFSYYTHVQKAVQAGDFWFLDSPEFVAVEEAINSAVMIDGSLLSVIDEKHWEEYPDDYMPFISTARGVISYPFLSGNATS